jgi:hypothetical protein
MDANPLDNIRNTESIRYVMVNGRMYDSFNMAQMGNHPVAAPKAFWRDSGTTGAQAQSETIEH